MKNILLAFLLSPLAFAVPLPTVGTNGFVMAVNPASRPFQALPWPANSSAAVQSAINSLGTNGGIVFIPPGEWAFNVRITNSGVVIQGSSSHISAGASRVRPFNTNSPVISVSDDTRRLNGTVIRDLTFSDGSVGLRLSGGAYRGRYEYLYFQDLMTAIEVVPPVAHPIAVNMFYGCVISAEGDGTQTNTVKIGQSLAYPAVFVTSTYFHGLHVSANGATTGDIFTVDSTDVHLAQTYMDLGSVSGVGIRLTNTVTTPRIFLSDLTLDCSPSTNVAVITYDTDKNLSKHFRGTGTFGGRVQLSDGTVMEVFGGGSDDYQRFYSYPFITGSLNIQDASAANAWDWNVDNRIYADASYFNVNSATRPVRLLSSAGSIEVRSLLAGAPALKIDGFGIAPGGISIGVTNDPGSGNLEVAGISTLDHIDADYIGMDVTVTDTNATRFTTTFTDGSANRFAHYWDAGWIPVGDAVGNFYLQYNVARSSGNSAKQGVIGAFYGAEGGGGGAISRLSGVEIANALASTASATNSYSLRILNPTDTSTGSITNNYGLYIENQTAGDLINRAIHVVGGESYFGGPVRLGDRSGTATLAAGTVTVNTARVTANSLISLTVNTPGGTVGTPYVSARSAGVNFTITSTSGTDTSTVAWMILEP